MPTEFPERMIEHVTRGWGEKGEAWLADLPAILTKCAEKWDLTLGETTDEIKANYVGYVTRADGSEAVLKVGVPHKDFSTEMEALGIYEGRGINRLIDKDEDLNAMLLERFSPGKMLSDHPDRDERARAAGEILVNLHKTPPPEGHGLPHFREWMQGAFRDTRECADLVRSQPYLDQHERGQAIMDLLMRPEEPQILLHGDLHHWNILSDETRGWVAIDPKGVIGASCLDVGRWINNAMGFDDDRATKAQKRKELLADMRILSDALGETQERMWAGAFIDKLTGSGWSLKYSADEWEEGSRETLEVIVEVGADVDEGDLPLAPS